MIAYVFYIGNRIKEICDLPKLNVRWIINKGGTADGILRVEYERLRRVIHDDCLVQRATNK